jgi:hypothetical protein
MDAKKMNENKNSNNSNIQIQEMNQEIFEKLSTLYPLLLPSSNEGNGRKPTIIEADGKNKIVYIYQFERETGQFIVIKKEFKDSDELEEILKFFCEE